MDARDELDQQTVTAGKAGARVPDADAPGTPAALDADAPDPREERERITQLVTGADTAVLTSRGADGSLHGRPLAVLQHDFDGVIRFLVQDPSEKTREIAADPNVNVSFASRHGYLSVAGTARLTRDPATIDELWGPAAQAWFAEGREDPSIAVLEVDGHGAEYWARTEPGAFALVKAAAAIFTRRTPDIGENRSVEL
ncbi:pyridoxamine 5'-phosphate oxidase family protein [Agromyces sp. MMS24-K17]|uniref:pyridoxamine 5'-phosphate oxidase family protein n=1 Tax=Agromyces sp. MMS24-K17 TaxID=3372850 RepID=UPI003754CF79